ncbi:antibiotic biosynthesis monooxygenase [Leptolyngbya sp. NK1-12]|uniref:Antibiotic biosynthesis monooxygenase n=1 Tax=Leptolyngbya sp. NK1-12 TaxID=2547451 RepID=A0AA96WJZ0_9CYAN|nr:antibiotic biosynthesis monooxygenase [Leptolyngbya sp. NK1-12]
MTHRIYRVYKFVVPNQAREEFLTQVKKTHQLLKAQPGFIQDFLLEQPADTEEFNVITIVEWRDAKAIEDARAAVMTMHKNTGFNPQEMFARLGIKADLGNYKPSMPNNPVAHRPYQTWLAKPERLLATGEQGRWSALSGE